MLVCKFKIKGYTNVGTVNFVSFKDHYEKLLLILNLFWIIII